MYSHIYILYFDIHEKAVIHVYVCVCVQYADIYNKIKLYDNSKDDRVEPTQPIKVCKR